MSMTGHQYEGLLTVIVIGFAVIAGLLTEGLSLLRGARNVLDDIEDALCQKSGDRPDEYEKAD
jgi:hypothetical protein